MSAGPVKPFIIESESEADDYLRDLLKKDDYESVSEAMHEVNMRARKYIKDQQLKKYFINKAKETLKTLVS
jgi:hypothetical protein